MHKVAPYFAVAGFFLVVITMIVVAVHIAGWIIIRFSKWDCVSMFVVGGLFLYIGFRYDWHR